MFNIILYHSESLNIYEYLKYQQHQCYHNQSPELIAKSIVDLATMLKGNSHDVSVSNIIVRTDNSNLYEKGCEVNAHLTEVCKERKLNLINHINKIKLNHVNQGCYTLIRKDRRYSVMPF